MSVATEGVSEMALALLTTISMPPKCAAVLSIASFTVDFVADVDDERQRLAARLLDCFGRGVDGAGKLRMWFDGLGCDCDIGAVAGGAKPNRQPDAARSAGDEQGFSSK